MRQALLLLILGLVLNAPLAFGFDYSLLGAMTYSNYNLSGAVPQSTSGKVAFGGGATASYELNPFFSIESGLLFLTHSYSVQINESSQVSQDQSLHFLDVPVLGRFMPLNQIALYLGPYYGIETSSGTSDFGLMTGGGLRLFLTDTIKLRLDALYQLGFLDLDTANSTQNSRNLIVFLGLLFETW